MAAILDGQAYSARSRRAASHDLARTLAAVRPILEALVDLDQEEAFEVLAYVQHMLGAANRSLVVSELARFDAGERQKIAAAAKAERQRRIEAAIREVCTENLAGCSGQKAAREIESAVRGRRAGLGHDAAARRALINARLRNRLGCLDDMPRAERIRQLIRIKQ